MRRIAVIGLLAMSTTLYAGCGSKQLTSDNISGLYEYDSGNRGTETVCFVLSPDGTYSLGNATDPVNVMTYSGTPSSGHWELLSVADNQRLSIGNSSLPIKRTSSGVRVVVDGDQDMYCDFAKPK
jgi:hypothetical protein